MTPDEEAEWLAWRNKGITASNVASDLTGKYGGAYAVVSDKLDKSKPKTSKKQQGDYDRGHTWEPKLTKIVEILTPYVVVGAEARIESAENPIHRCTPDGFLIDPETLEAAGGVPSVDLCDAGVEYKTVRSGQDWQWDYWRAQIQWQMHCTGMERTLLFVAVTDHDNEGLAGGGLRPYWIERDDEFIAFLVELGDAMWAQVQTGKLPQPDTASALPLVRWQNRFANPEAKNKDLSVHADLIDRVLDLKESKSAGEKELDQKIAVLVHSMGDATEGGTPTAVVKYSEPNAKGTRSMRVTRKKSKA